jgi:hypothetical protein
MPKYKKMLQDIDNLVSTDFCFDICCRQEPPTRKEAIKMKSIIGDIHQISHSIHCKSCLKEKYKGRKEK